MPAYTSTKELRILDRRFPRSSRHFEVVKLRDSTIVQKMHSWFWIAGWFPTRLAVAGNALVIWLIATRRRLRTTANWFVLSLAVADLCIGMFLFPILFTCKRRWFSCTAQNEHIISTWLSFFCTRFSSESMCYDNGSLCRHCHASQIHHLHDAEAKYAINYGGMGLSSRPNPTFCCFDLRRRI